MKRSKPGVTELTADQIERRVRQWYDDAFSGRNYPKDGVEGTFQELGWRMQVLTEFPGYGNEHRRLMVDVVAERSERQSAFVIIEGYGRLEVRCRIPNRPPSERQFRDIFSSYASWAERDSFVDDGPWWQHFFGALEDFESTRRKVLLRNEAAARSRARDALASDLAERDAYTRAMNKAGRVSRIKKRSGARR